MCSKSFAQKMALIKQLCITILTQFFFPFLIGIQFLQPLYIFVNLLYEHVHCEKYYTKYFLMAFVFLFCWVCFPVFGHDLKVAVFVLCFKFQIRHCWAKKKQTNEYK